MTTSSLQFGPEWMRKGPSNASKQSNGGQQQQSSATTPTTGAAPSLSSRRNHVPGLGSMQSHSAGGVPTPVSTPTAAPSPGTFSFAAAAAGGADRSASTPGGTGASAANGSSSAAAAAALHHHQQLLSLYSSKEGSRGALSPTSEVAGGAGGGDASAAAPSTGTGGGSQGRRKLFPERERERDPNSRRSLSTHEANAMMSPAAPASEPPRGLNARGTSVSRDREADQHRPGLFQRANSSGQFGGATVPSPTLPRERFSGIQGGVLSGVVPPERRRKESGDVRLVSGESRKHPTSGATGAAAPPAPSLPSAPVEEETLWERRGGNRNVSASADTSEPGEVSTSSGFKEKPSLEGLASPADAGDQSGARSAGTPASASWSSARRRERAPGEGPIGPPADGSAGFGKFAAYERKRERMASHPASEGWRPSSSSASGTGVNGEQPLVEEAANKEDDRVEVASSALDGLNISEESAAMPPPSQQQNQPPAPTAPWSAESQNWLYRDPSGQVQGPFSAALMQDWYQQSYFNDDLMIRAEEEPEFHRLIDVIAAGGHNPQPFLVPPPSMSRPSPPRPQQVNELLSSLHAGGSSPFLAHKSPQQGNNGWNGDGSWQAAAPQQQQQRPGYISSPFDTAGGAFGSSPFLPYAGSLGGAAGGDGGFDAKLRQQEEYLAMIRHREMEEHRQQQQQAQQMQQPHQSAPSGAARGLSFGEFPAIDPFVGGWSPAPQQQQQQQAWGANQSLWAQPSESGTEARRADSQQTTPWATEPEAGAGDVQPIGTPVRSRSPVVQTKAAIPESKSKSPEEQPVETAPAPAPRPATPQPEDPAPEHEWPQSPSAVEFATEPDMTQSVGAQDNEFQQARGAGKSAVAPSPQTGSTAASRSAAGGNVKVVGADQFRRAGSATPQSGAEAPLSSFLAGSAQGATSGAPAPAKAAPWAQQASTQNQDKGSENAAKSLREIQEAEARQAEARRTAERAAAAQRRANSANTGPDSSTLPSTMSWGLASIPSSATAKADAAASAAAAAQQPAAWTDTAAGKAAGTPKKTLTEIQEEERKRAQSAQQLKQAQNAAARKAYLESATRQAAAPTSAAAAAASGWSIVGAGGKASTPAPAAAAAAPTPASIPARPTIVGASGKKTASSVKIPGVAGAWGASGSTPASSTNGVSTPASIPAKPPATRKNAAAAPSNPSPAAPSPEFIRYCHEQLKGLNVKVDDFIEMLLSFPLDPSQDVVEIIAESIYANSSTLDGRRVANDFVAKRKMDAGFRGDVGGSSSTSSTSGASGSGVAGGRKTTVNGGGGLGGGISSSGNRSPTNSSSTTSASASAKGQNGFQQVVKKGGKRK